MLMWCGEIGLTVKFTFNCILIDKDGIRHLDLSRADPIAAMEGVGKDSMVDVPNPPIDVAQPTAATA